MGVGGMGGGGGFARGGELREGRELTEELLAAPDTLTIVVNAGEVVLTDADGHVRHFATNGKKEKHQLMAGVIQSKTRWRADTLEMEFSPPGGAKIVQAYTYEPETRQLVVTVKSSGGYGGSQPASRRVYDNVLDQR
jgi:hypothetical protein